MTTINIASSTRPTVPAVRLYGLDACLINADDYTLRALECISADVTDAPDTHSLSTVLFPLGTYEDIVTCKTLGMAMIHYTYYSEEYQGSYIFEYMAMPPSLGYMPMLSLVMCEVCAVDGHREPADSFCPKCQHPLCVHHTSPFGLCEVCELALDLAESDTTVVARGAHQQDEYGYTAAQSLSLYL